MTWLYASRPQRYFLRMVKTMRASAISLSRNRMLVCLWRWKQPQGCGSLAASLWPDVMHFVLHAAVCTWYCFLPILWHCRKCTACQFFLNPFSVFQYFSSGHRRTRRVQCHARAIHEIRRRVPFSVFGCRQVKVIYMFLLHFETILVQRCFLQPLDNVCHSVAVYKIEAGLRCTVFEFVILFMRFFDCPFNQVDRI